MEILRGLPHKGFVLASSASLTNLDRWLHGDLRGLPHSVCTEIYGACPIDGPRVTPEGP